MLREMIARGEGMREAAVRELGQPGQPARHVARARATITILDARLADLRQRLAALGERGS